MTALFGFLAELLDAALSPPGRQGEHPDYVGFWDWRRRWRCVCGEAVKLHGSYAVKPENEWICPHCAAPSWVAIEGIGRRTWGKWEWKPIPKKEEKT